MALYGILKGTPGIMVASDGTRKNFRSRRDLAFKEEETSGPFEGLYVFMRDDFLFYVSPDHVSITPVRAIDKSEEED